MKKPIILAFTLLCACVQFSKAQFAMGGGVGWYRYSGLANPMAINIRANYLLNEKGALALSYNYNTPFTYMDEAYANATSSASPYTQVSVDITNKVSVHNINLAYHFTIVHENEDDFSLYLLGGLGFTFGTEKVTKISPYDKTQYSLGNRSTENSFGGPIIDMGLGTNIFLSERLSLFGEAKVGFPANTVSNDTGSGSSTTFENPIPLHLNLSVGARFTIIQ